MTSEKKIRNHLG